MTSQQQADLALAQWQQHRELPPEDRMRHLVMDYFGPSQSEYRETMERVALAMEDA